MRWMKLVAVSIVALGLAGCMTGGDESVLSGSEAEAIPDAQIVWVGTGTAWVYDDDSWVRSPSQDYEFLVRQNRFAQRWESLKIQNRTHPEYDGSAGDADQQHFFEIAYGAPDADGVLPVHVSSTYGDGTGESDATFEHAQLEIDAETSRFAPYNRIRITQHYDYAAGELNETVELVKVTNDGETPFFKIEEEARIFVPVEELPR